MMTSREGTDECGDRVDASLQNLDNSITLLSKQLEEGFSLVGEAMDKVEVCMVTGLDRSLTLARIIYRTATKSN